MPLTPYGRREWLAITLVLGAGAGALGLFVSWWLVLPVAAVWVAVVSFFRDPIRSLPRDLEAGDFLSPADGVVTRVLEVDHHEATGGPARIVRIFLSLLNVHVNRAPCDGEVIEIIYRPGKFHDARTEACATENESNLVILRRDPGETIGLRQVSGKVARRIVCALAPGDRVTRGQKFGMIKFGSTAELILPRPADATIHVTEGQTVKGGRTVLATLPPAAAPAAHDEPAHAAHT